MPFEAGQSGNPGGRPKKFKIRDHLTDDQIKVLVEKAYKLADDGKTEMVKFLLEQVYGKAPQSIDHTTKGEKLNNSYDELTTKELRGRIEELEANRDEKGAGTKESEAVYIT